jgi:hypothetical protein
MNSILPSAAVIFPRTPATWYILPRPEKRDLKIRDSNRKQSGELDWMTEVTDSQNTIKELEGTGPEHWEEQRRRWTKDFDSINHYDLEDVHDHRFLN